MFARSMLLRRTLTVGVVAPVRPTIRCFSAAPRRFDAAINPDLPKTSTVIPPATSSSPSPAQPLPYFVHKSKTGNFPIYQQVKAQGPKLLTRLRKCEGNLAVLKQHLMEALTLGEKDIEINHLTRHIIIKGHRKFEVEAFLKNKGF